MSDSFGRRTRLRLVERAEVERCAHILGPNSAAARALALAGTLVGQVVFLRDDNVLIVESVSPQGAAASGS